MKNNKWLILIMFVLFVSVGVWGCSSSKVDSDNNGESAGDSEGSESNTEDYPTKAVQLINPYAAGGPNDIVARAISSVADEHLGQPIVTVTQDGAAGAVGTKAVADADPDGYTLVIGTGGSHSIQPQLEDVGYDKGDFIPISQITINPVLINVGWDSPFENFEEVIEYATENPEELQVGTSGHGSHVHLAFEGALNEAGVEMTMKHYDGIAPSLKALLGGELDLHLDFPPNTLEHFEAKNMRPLAVLTSERIDELPDVPTVKELGYDFNMSAWKTIFAPAGTPEPIVNKLREAFKDIHEDDSFKALASETGSKLHNLDGPDFQKEWNEEYSTINELISELDLKD